MKIKKQRPESALTLPGRKSSKKVNINIITSRIPIIYERKKVVDIHVRLEILGAYDYSKNDFIGSKEASKHLDSYRYLTIELLQND